MKADPLRLAQSGNQAIFRNFRHFFCTAASRSLAVAEFSTHLVCEMLRSTNARRKRIDLLHLRNAIRMPEALINGYAPVPISALSGLSCATRASESIKGWQEPAPVKSMQNSFNQRITGAK